MIKTALSQLNLVIVDPVSSMRHITAGLLRGLAVGSTRLTSSAQDALLQMRRARPDLVLAEWDMPEADGLDLLREMRADAALADVPVVLITADIERGRVEEAIRSGVSDLLVKPYSVQRLEDKIVGAVRRPVPSARQAPQPAAAPEPAKAPAEKPLLLIVDDTPDNVRLLVDLFREDYRIKVADNGVKALNICAADPAPDLVLLDVMMPGMDGFEVARRLRTHPNGELIPVIFVTALTDDHSKLRGFDQGAVDFISKPVDPDMLRLRVRNFIRYVEMHKRRQQEYDEMLAQARLHADAQRQLREQVEAPLAEALARLGVLATGATAAEAEAVQAAARQALDGVAALLALLDPPSD
jgi:two-component system sensor histidine kinase/response regulator